MVAVERMEGPSNDFCHGRWSEQLAFCLVRYCRDDPESNGLYSHYENNGHDCRWVGKMFEAHHHQLAQMWWLHLGHPRPLPLRDQ